MKMKYLFVYCAFLFIMLEGLSRLFISIPSFWHIISRNKCDSTWRLRWIRRCHKNDGLQIYKFDAHDLSKGWRLKPNIKDMAVFGDNILNSNSKGIRGREEYKYEKDLAKKRILILGDSYTFGEGLSDNETYPFYLQQLFPDVEVINFGVHGYGHDQMLLYLKEEGVKYKPDIVVLGYIPSNMNRNMLRFRDYAKPKFKLINNQLILQNPTIPLPEIMLKRELWRLKFLDILRILDHGCRVKFGFYVKERDRLTDAIINEIASTVRNINAIPIFVYLGGLRKKNQSDEMSREEEKFFKHWRNKVVHCVYVRPYINSAKRKGVRLKKQGHYAPKTNQIIAQRIRDYLIENNILHHRQAKTPY